MDFRYGCNTAGGIFMTIDNVTVIIESGALSAKEAERYIRKIQRHSKGRTLKRVSFRLADGHLDLRYAFEGIPFERIRRISYETPKERKAV